MHTLFKDKLISIQFCSDIVRSPFGLPYVFVIPDLSSKKLFIDKKEAFENSIV